MDVGFLTAFTLSGKISITDPRLWWPWNMKPEDPAYLYTFQVTAVAVHGSSSGLMDVYRLKFGIRSLRWTNKEILINNQPFYCRLGVLGRGDDLGALIWSIMWHRNRL